MMTIFPLAVAFVCGMVLGAVYFFSLWRATKTIINSQSLGVTFLFSRILSLFVLLGVFVLALASGVSASAAVAALLGFFSIRLAATRWARSNKTDSLTVSPKPEDGHAH